MYILRVAHKILQLASMAQFLIEPASSYQHCQETPAISTSFPLSFVAPLHPSPRQLLLLLLPSLLHPFPLLHIHIPQNGNVSAITSSITLLPAIGETNQTILTPTTRNITFHAAALTREERSTLRKQQGLTIWLTGLSASGKSTIAVELEHQLLRDRGVHAYRLDGDNIRFGLNKDLGFSETDRNENIRRIAEVAKLFADSSAVAITSFISPYRKDRETARQLHEVPTPGEESGLPFVEVHVDVPVEVAEQRDPKGLYKKAREGIIKEFTGISAPYEAPEKPEVYIRNVDLAIPDAVKQIIDYLDEKGYLPPKQE